MFVDMASDVADASLASTEESNKNLTATKQVSLLLFILAALYALAK